MLHKPRLVWQNNCPLMLSMALCLLLTIFTSCTSEPTMVPAPTMLSSPTSTAIPTTQPEPTETYPPTRTPRPTEVPLRITNDITYTQNLWVDNKGSALDIYAPAELGAWPVIILAHGYTGTKDEFVRKGKILAREGAVVFAITWPAFVSMTGDEARLRERTETLNCAVRFVRAKAVDYTQTPEKVTLVGHSLGGWMGLLTSLAGDGLDAQWVEFAASNGGPPSQVSCVVTDGVAHVNAFVGYSGGYTIIDQEDKNPDLMSIMSLSAHIGENPDLRIRAIQGIHDEMLPEEIVKTSEELIAEFAGAGYDAQWLEIDAAHAFPASGKSWEAIRQIIMDTARQ